MPLPLLIIIVIVAASMPTTEASSIKRADIVGTWLTSNRNWTAQIEFLENGKFRGFLTNARDEAFDYEGRWELDGIHLRYVYGRSDLPMRPPGYVDVDEVIGATAEYLDLRYESGEVHRYRRVDEKGSHGSQQTNREDNPSGVNRNQ